MEMLRVNVRFYKVRVNIRQRRDTREISQWWKWVRSVCVKSS